MVSGDREWVDRWRNDKEILGLINIFIILIIVIVSWVSGLIKICTLNMYSLLVVNCNSVKMGKQLAEASLT